MTNIKNFQTINQQVRLNLNIGITDNFTVQVTIPGISREHDHRIEVGVEPDTGANEGRGNFENFDGAGLGDIRMMGKYAFLPTLRSMIVIGIGVDFPTGNFQARNSEGAFQEPTLQIGRGQFGAVGQLYQAYEIIPHFLNQFLSYTYRHTFENKFNYRFGDTHIISGGLAVNATPKIVFSGQLNWILRAHDKFKGEARTGRRDGPGLAGETDIDETIRMRSVPNTGSTILMLTPGITVNLGDNTSWYFFSQVPVVKDFNGGLEQGVSYLTGFVRYFDVGNLFEG